MNKKVMSTFEREMKDKKFRKSFERGYKAFLLSELITAVMENDEKSVRALAREIGLSATAIQKIRSGKQTDIKTSNFVSIVQACGYKVILEKGNDRIIVNDEKVENEHHLSFAHAR